MIFMNKNSLLEPYYIKSIHLHLSTNIGQGRIIKGSIKKKPISFPLIGLLL